MKEWLLGSFGLSNDAMHIHVGMVLFLGLVLALRGRGAPWLPLALLTVMSLVAEVFDVMALRAVTAPADPWESLRDVANTLAWPMVLGMLMARYSLGRNRM
jgi:AcrR family transcriptional regulator